MKDIAGRRNSEYPYATSLPIPSIDVLWVPADEFGPPEGTNLPERFPRVVISFTNTTRPIILCRSRPTTAGTSRSHRFQWCSFDRLFSQFGMHGRPIQFTAELFVVPEAEQTDHSDEDESGERGRTMTPPQLSEDNLSTAEPSPQGSDAPQSNRGEPTTSVSDGINHTPSAVDPHHQSEVTRGTSSHDSNGIGRHVLHPTQVRRHESATLQQSQTRLQEKKNEGDILDEPENNGTIAETNEAQNLKQKIPEDLKLTMKLDDDSELAICNQKDPEGARPKHRSGDSRRFSDDFAEKMRKQLHIDTEALNHHTNGNTAETPSGFPPLITPKEIKFSQVPENDEGESDEVSAPTTTTSPPVQGALTPPPAPMKGSLPERQEEATDEYWRPINDSYEEAPLVNMPYRLEPQAPRSFTDQAPQESDLSVFSVHSGYGMSDPNAPPRVVHGTMVQSSTAMHQQPQYTNIPSHIHQAPPQHLQHPHSLGSASGYPHYQPPSHHQQHHYAPATMPPVHAIPPPIIMAPPPVSKRKIHFRLVEDIPTPNTARNLRSSFLSFRRTSNRGVVMASPVVEEPKQRIDRGRVTVSWYEGTTTSELMEHVRNTVIRKLGIQGTTKLSEIRILDEGSNPPEEIVLSPYIPSESHLLLRFSTRDAGGDVTPHHQSYIGGAPDSPSAAPSPHRSALDLEGLGLNPNQLALLGTRLKGLQVPAVDFSLDASVDAKDYKTPFKKSTRIIEPRKPKTDHTKGESRSVDSSPGRKEKDDESSVFETQSLHPEDQITKSLQNITELLVQDRQKIRYVPKQEKRQVIFVLANYFVLFLSLIAISAEIQARAPGWNSAIENQLNNVKNCSQDQEALFECVSNGDMAGLVASVVLWISRSAATKRIFLFGFDSPRKLWTVVYESLVTAVCWGFSYMFIRRGMNPDTNRNFLQKYWKDAVYGSLAGFNAAFMKHILRNLIPQEAIEDALQDRQLKILSWLK